MEFSPSLDLDSALALSISAGAAEPPPDGGSAGFQARETLGDDTAPAFDSTSRARGTGMAPEENSGRASEDLCPHATPPAPAPALGPVQRRLAAARRRLVIAALPVLEAGGTLALAARGAGASPVTLWRILQRADATACLRGDRLRPSLADRAAWLACGPLDRLAPARSEKLRSRCVWEPLLALEPVRDRLLRLYAATIRASGEAMTHGRRTGSVALSLELFADAEECPPELARRLRRGYQPAALRRFLGRLTPEVEQGIRGSRHLELHGAVSRRDQTIRLPDGSRALNRAGFIWSLDDMSVNQPYWVETPEGDPLLTRQVLFARDVATGRWLGCELVARPREAYRAADILRFLRRLMDSLGKPGVLRLERGTWAARAIDGAHLSEDVGLESRLEDRPAMDDEERALVQDGLRAIGCELQYVHTPHLKGELESAFRTLQPVLAALSDEFVNIGAHAGEFERAAKQVRQARNGSRHPAALGFASQDQLAPLIERAMLWLNGRTRNGAVSADARWEADLQSEGWRPQPLTARDAAAFLPDLREVQIQGLRVTLRHRGVPFDFRAAEFADLGNGYRVSVRWDPTAPALGAAVYSREGATLRNFHGVPIGDFLCFAAYEPPAPQYTIESASLAARLGPERVTVQELYGADVEDHGRAGRKAQEDRLRAFVRTVTRVLPRPGAPALAAASIRDGRQAVEVATLDAPAASRRDARQAMPRFRSALEDALA